MPNPNQTLHLTHFDRSEDRQTGPAWYRPVTQFRNPPAQISETESCLGVPMRSVINLIGTTDEETKKLYGSCGACALTLAGTVTHSIRLRSGCRKQSLNLDESLCREPSETEACPRSIMIR